MCHELRIDDFVLWTIMCARVGIQAYVYIYFDWSIVFWCWVSLVCSLGYKMHIEDSVFGVGYGFVNMNDLRAGWVKGHGKGKPRMAINKI